jgi:hypothetical protein
MLTNIDFMKPKNFATENFNAFHIFLIISQIATILWDIEIYNGVATFYINRFVKYFI